MTDSSRNGTIWWCGVVSLVLPLGACSNGTPSPDGSRGVVPFGIVIARDSAEDATLVTVRDTAARLRPWLSGYGVHLAVSDSQVPRPRESVRDADVESRIVAHEMEEDKRTVALVIEGDDRADMVEVQFVHEEGGVVDHAPRITMVNGVPAVGPRVTVAEIWRDRMGRERDTVMLELKRCDTVTVRVIQHVLGPVTLAGRAGPPGEDGAPGTSFPEEGVEEETRKRFRLMMRSEVLLDSVPNCCPGS